MSKYSRFEGKVKDDTTVIYTFESAAEFARECKEVGAVYGRNGWASKSWYGGETFSESMALCEIGLASRVKEAEKVAREFQDGLDLSMMMPQWQMSVAGAFPSVPAYLAGVPETMYNKVEDHSERSPIKIWYCVTSSGGCDEKSLTKRGIAATALFMALSAIRPCELQIFSGLDLKHSMGNSIVSVKIPQPVSLAMAAYVLTSQGFARGLTYTYLTNRNDADGAWPSAVTKAGWSASYERRCQIWRDVLNAAPQDIVFPHAALGDASLKDPIGYCKGIIEQFKVTMNEY